jgi:hypothetical protein
MRIPKGECLYWQRRGVSISSPFRTGEFRSIVALELRRGVLVLSYGPWDSRAQRSLPHQLLRRIVPQNSHSNWYRCWGKTTNSKNSHYPWYKLRGKVTVGSEVELIQKPFMPNVLLTKVREALDGVKYSGAEAVKQTI